MTLPITALDIGEEAARSKPPLGRFQAKAFAAFRLSGTRTDRLAIGAPASLKDAVTAAQALCLHREHLAIRETDMLGGTSSVHLFAIRQKAGQWMRLPGEIAPRRIAPLFADPICAMDAAIFDAGQLPGGEG